MNRDKKKNEDRIKQTKIEDKIFIIYFIIIIMSLYANYIERIYLKYNDYIAKERYRNILFIIFGIATLVYFYYAYNAYQDLCDEQDVETKRLNELAFVASVLVLISGIIILYIIYQDRDVNIELAFN